MTTKGAGIAEMLLQSRPGELTLLPALPAAWSQGKVNGLRGRGGMTVSMEWTGSRLVRGNLLHLSRQEAASFAVHSPLAQMPGRPSLIQSMADSFCHGFLPRSRKYQTDIRLLFMERKIKYDYFSISAGLYVGNGNGSLSNRGRLSGGRKRSVHLGYLCPYVRQGVQRR